MRPIFIFYITLMLLPFAGRACDDHVHSVKMNTWHTKALRPHLPRIAAGNMNADSAFASFAEIMIRREAHLKEAYQVLGQASVVHTDILALYKTQTGKAFKQDQQVLACVEELKSIRSKQTYMSGCAVALQDMRIKISGSVKDPLLLEAIYSIIDFYEEDGSFWDLAAATYELSPKAKDAVRHDAWDLDHFSTYYMALRELGLKHEQAHAVASLETAYEAATCKHCGVW